MRKRSLDERSEIRDLHVQRSRILHELVRLLAGQCIDNVFVKLFVRGLVSAHVALKCTISLALARPMPQAPLRTAMESIFEQPDAATC
jgi:hypothetical protein